MNPRFGDADHAPADPFPENAASPRCAAAPGDRRRYPADTKGTAPVHTEKFLLAGARIRAYQDGAT